jgi:hypothetical protein
MEPSARGVAFSGYGYGIRHDYGTSNRRFATVSDHANQKGPKEIDVGGGPGWCGVTGRRRCAPRIDGARPRNPKSCVAKTGTNVL